MGNEQNSQDYELKTLAVMQKYIFASLINTAMYLIINGKVKNRKQTLELADIMDSYVSCTACLDQLETKIFSDEKLTQEDETKILEMVQYGIQLQTAIYDLIDQIGHAIER